jgi:hypothetical protein
MASTPSTADRKWGRIVVFEAEREMSSARLQERYHISLMREDSSVRFDFGVFLFIRDRLFFVSKVRDWQ